MAMILSTQRIYLRPVTKADTPQAHRLLGDPVAAQYYLQVNTPQQTEAWIDLRLSRYEEVGHDLWAMCHLEDDRYLGHCGLILQRDVDGVDEIEIGYGLLPENWGQGYATEAALACRDYAFKTLDVDRVISLIDPRNSGSQNVAKRVGMSLEKTTHRWGRDLYVFSMRRGQA